MSKDCTNCYHHGQHPKTGNCLNCGYAKQYRNWQPLFEDMVAGLAKPGEEIVASLTPLTADLLHMAVGVAGEAGELVDCIKKYAIYGKPMDLINLVEELGDLEFYMERIRQRTGVTREETLLATINKLGKRYGDKYSDQAAQVRADKQIEVNLKLK